YLLCADELVKNNNDLEANKIYTELLNQNLSTSIKQSALVGIINTSRNKSDEILNRISSEPNELKFIPISKIRELPENVNLNSYAELLSSLEPANQIQLLSVIEDRKDKSVKPFVLETLKSNIKEVRIASIRTLTNIGDETDIIRLATVAANETGDEANYARSALNLLSGNKVNQRIVTSIASSENKVKFELIKAIGTRSIKSALNNIIDYANSDDKKLQSETLSSMAEISGIEELPFLINIIISQKSNSDRKKVERTISKVLAKFPNQNGSEPLIKTLNSKIDNDSKFSLLRLLGFTGDANALQVLREEIKSNDEEIKIASIKGLSNWASAEPLNDLKQCTILAKNEKVKSAALKGFTKFIAMDNSLTDNQKVDLYKISLQHAKTSNERNIALDGIGHTDCFESLEAVKSYINQTDVKQTVDDAINRVSWHLHQDDPEKVKEFVKWFLSKIKDERFQTKITHLINVIDRYIISKESN
ncbi:MAG: HEAT repeat domain-containing protein, partial [Ignavibacteriae bacterium]|nr:HEAT repeat domain-containing protein [Ignavibacteriota bacterium]